jgi:guanylate kinase
MRRGFPVVLSAASGTGKTTLANMLLDADQNLVLSISSTTRRPRGDEQDGVEYHFVDDETFRAMIARGAFIEHAEVHGNLYGSSAEWTRDRLDEGKDVLFDIDVQGGRQIRQRFPSSCLIFLLPPSLDVLATRLRGRGTDDDATVTRRLDAARSEIEAGLTDYDYVIVNDRLDRALADLTSIVRAHRLRAADRAALRRDVYGS